MRHLKYLVVGAMLAAGAWAETDLEATKPMVLAPEPGESGSYLFELNSDKQGRGDSSPLIQVGGRIDAAFSSNTPVAQGFSLPSLRLNADGSVGHHLEYGLALGQTREFSSAMLPQMLPVDAFMVLKTESNDDFGSLRLKVGMFNPMLNPWWTPDLADVPLPDYHAVHKTLLLDNDLGVEVSFQPMAQRLEIFAGAFNGNGVFSVNTNNSRAFTGGLRVHFPVGGARLGLGFSAYGLTQASSGSVNFKSNSLADIYVSLEAGRFLLGLDLLTGGFEDSTRRVASFGGAGFLHVPLFQGVGVFSRLEGLRNSPIGGGFLTQLQIGPQIGIDKAFQSFLFYEVQNSSASGHISSAQVRLRLSI